MRRVLILNDFHIKMFDITGKVAIISGGASGIGFHCAKVLLRNGLRGVTLADINNKFGETALQELEGEFGLNRAIYVLTDVSNKESFEGAFKRTIEVFHHIDILINNAGVVDESDNARIEKAIDVNIKGTINGILLAMEHYIPKYKTDSEGVIINISSTVSLDPCGYVPIYVCSKFAINGLTLSFGIEEHFERTKVRVVALCPGLTYTSIMDNLENRTMGKAYGDLIAPFLSTLVGQGPESVAEGMMKVLKNSKTGSIWVVEYGREPCEYFIPRRNK